MKKNLETELSKVLSTAGEILEKDYPANELVKSVAGSALKCLGDKGTPSKEVKEKALKILTANRRTKTLYNTKELSVAEYVLNHKVKVNFIVSEKKTG